MKKRCPRCGALFDCLHDEDIRLCHCATIELDDQTRKCLKENYSDCLCHNCLMAIKKMFHADETVMCKPSNNNGI